MKFYRTSLNYFLQLHVVGKEISLLLLVLLAGIIIKLTQDRLIGQQKPTLNFYVCRFHGYGTSEVTEAGCTFFR